MSQNENEDDKTKETPKIEKLEWRFQAIWSGIGLVLAIIMFSALYCAFDKKAGAWIILVTAAASIPPFFATWIKRDHYKRIDQQNESIKLDLEERKLNQEDDKIEIDKARFQETLNQIETESLEKFKKIEEKVSGGTYYGSLSQPDTLKSIENLARTEQMVTRIFQFYDNTIDELNKAVPKHQGNPPGQKEIQDRINMIEKSAETIHNKRPEVEYKGKHIMYF